MKQVIDEQFLQQTELFVLTVNDYVTGLFGGNHKTKKFGSSCEFSDFRDYIPGDDPTKIDWNLYGRFEKLYLKLYLDERQMHTRIYIDASESMSFFKKDELAVRLATTLAYMSVKEMDKVTIYYIKGNQCEPVLESIVGKDAFLGSVSRMNSIVFDGESQISEAITRSTVGYGDGKSIIISDFLTDNNFFDAIDYLRSKKRDVLCIQILSKEETQPTSRGKTIIYDSEDINRLYKNNINRSIVAAYKEAVKYISKRIDDFCISRGAAFISATTEDSLKDIVLKKMINKGVIE